GRASRPGEIVFAVECGHFKVWKMRYMSPDTALQAFENRKVSGRLASCVRKNLLAPWRSHLWV
ncbi:MAG: hypothetical protein AAFW47_05840, partial [Pseudomonadota bacterium]